MDEIVKDFLIESRENLDRLDQELVKLETDPQSAELLASVFRTIHTIKGTCGFLGFRRLEKVAHAGENLLSRLRDGQLVLTGEVTSGLLAMVDAVRHMLSEIQATGQDGDKDYPELLEELKRLQDAGGMPASAPATVEMPQHSPAQATGREAGAPEKGPTAKGSPEPAAPLSAAPPETAASRGALEAQMFEPATPSPSPENASPPGSQPSHRPSPGKIGGLLVERGSVTPEHLAAALREQENGDRRRVGEILIALGACHLDDVLAAQQVLEARGREAGVETVRVGVNLLDEMMNLVGELVQARNQLLQFARSNKEKSLQAISQRMNLVVAKLQEEVMKTRMQPIGNIWNKFPRTVRDLALGCGKEVRLEMEGQDTELDRTIIEAIKDPMTHLVRNAIDHGIETPEARKQAAKGSTGILKLRAFHESGQVILEISDDGAGLNAERLRKKAIERGLLTPQQAARMTDRDAFNLIFLPGFSTAEKVTNVSGRGVGMDVVRTNVERIGGTVEIQSTPGLGATVRVKIPLTLAIIPALMVRCGGERFAIPQISLTELLRLEDGKGIEQLHGSLVYRLRGRLLPVVFLSDVFDPRTDAHSSSKEQSLPPAATRHSVNIVVLEAMGQQFGLAVDDILNTEEIVVKPLARRLKKINAYAGATILGDGTVALILDVKGLAQRASIRPESVEAIGTENAHACGAVKKGPAERQLLILADNGCDSRVAIPLGRVARLEQFPASVVQGAGQLEVMQYRGQIIPMLRLSQIFPGTRAEEKHLFLEVVVCTENGRTAGLIVDRIVDIVELSAAVEAVSQRPGVIGTCVIDRKMTDLLDVPAIVRSAVPGYLDASSG